MSSEDESVVVVGGVDTHADTLHVAAIDDRGAELGDREFPTTPSGYRRALAFLASYGDLVVVGVEGTCSYGAGFTQAALGAGVAVVEVVRPDRSERRRLGKSDPIDAYQAARAALAQHRTAPVKDPALEGIRALHNARRSAVKARHAAQRQIKQQLVTAPVAIREKYRNRVGDDLVLALARARTWVDRPPVEQAVLIALKSLATRCLDLQAEHAALGEEIDALVTALNPGREPRPAGRARHRPRHRRPAAHHRWRQPRPAAHRSLLRRPVRRSARARVFGQDHPAPTLPQRRPSGDRAANNALYRIAIVRMACDPHTKAFVARQRAAGRSTREIIRILKRAIAREVFRYLTTPVEVPTVADLRPARQAKNITITAVAQHFGVWPATISELERGTRRNDALAQAYREWLNAA